VQNIEGRESLSKNLALKLPFANEEATGLLRVSLPWQTPTPTTAIATLTVTNTTITPTTIPAIGGNESVAATKSTDTAEDTRYRRKEEKGRAEENARENAREERE